jgi:hypothetical protein
VGNQLPTVWADAGAAKATRAQKSGLQTDIVNRVFIGPPSTSLSAALRRCHFTEYLVNAPPACTSEFGPSAA